MAASAAIVSCGVAVGRCRDMGAHARQRAARGRLHRAGACKRAGIGAEAAAGVGHQLRLVHAELVAQPADDGRILDAERTNGGGWLQCRVGRQGAPQGFPAAGCRLRRYLSDARNARVVVGMQSVPMTSRSARIAMGIMLLRQSVARENKCLVAASWCNRRLLWRKCIRNCIAHRLSRSRGASAGNEAFLLRDSRRAGVSGRAPIWLITSAAARLPRRPQSASFRLRV